MLYRKYRRRRFLRHALSAPIIYSALVAFVILDLWIELYHRTCFPLYGIPYVKRSDYIRIDRQKLKYLNLLEKMNCMYCGYGNGLLHYVSTIAGETEKYWCGIRHNEGKGFHAPEHHASFLAFGDKEGFKQIGKNN